jgi:hypothetical protein
MELVGVCNVTTDWRIWVAINKGSPLFGSTLDSILAMRKVGLKVEDTLDDL